MYELMTSNGANRTIDYRSDTVTQPSQEMRDAIASADVGDDVYGEDPTLISLEKRVAELVGKEAGLFLPSGTQSNLVALLSHCGRGEEYIVGSEYHAFKSEAGGAAALGGIVPCLLVTDENGGVSAADVTAAIKPDNPHYPISRLLCLENTVSGRVVPLQQMNAAADAARSAGLSVHLDGARIFNAATALGVSAATVAAQADTVSVCLSKGLGAPVGSVLCGPREFINLALRNRKLVGGGMRQAGLLAAAGLYAVENNINRLADDHQRAKRLAQGLSKIPGVFIDMGRVQSNMVFAETAPDAAAPLKEYLAKQGITIGGSRMVVHLDIDDNDIERAIKAFQDFFST